MEVKVSKFKSWGREMLLFVMDIVIGFLLNLTSTLFTSSSSWCFFFAVLI
jgi:hypothetical protein